MLGFPSWLILHFGGFGVVWNSVDIVVLTGLELDLPGKIQFFPRAQRNHHHLSRRNHPWCFGNSLGKWPYGLFMDVLCMGSSRVSTSILVLRLDHLSSGGQKKVEVDSCWGFFTPQKPTWQWTNNHLKMCLLLRLVISYWQVSFRGGN